MGIRIKHNYFLNGEYISQKRIPETAVNVGTVKGWYTSKIGNTIKYNEYYFEVK